ncbi:hypothetical protein HDV62DRAFT_395139 [Trichoderma sp. SZMC 28011]
MRSLKFAPLLLLFNHVHHALCGAIQYVVREATEPLDKGKPLPDASVDALPAYDTVRVATVHFEYLGTSAEVPQVSAELAAMQFIFQQYGFEVRDLAIPQSSSSDAQSFLESQITSLYSGLSGPGPLVIIIYGGHGDEGGVWAISRGTEQIAVSWSSIDANIIAPTGIDTFQIVDACFAGGFVATSKDIAPDSWAGRAAFSAIASASACSVAGANQLAFTKAVIHTLAPADGALPPSFTPTSLFNALPRVNRAYAQLTGDSQEVNAIISGNYVPQLYELGTTIPPLGTGPTRKIAALDC